MARVHVTATLNGNDVEFLCETRQTLLQILRDELHLTGTKEGCATGDCGACSVTVDGRLMCSCLILGAEVQGKSIQTIEGMAANGNNFPKVHNAAWPGIVVWAAGYRSGETNGDSHLDAPSEEAPAQRPALAYSVKARAKVEEADLPL